MANLTYKGRPLRRKDDVIFYGSFDDKYIIYIKILESKKEKDLDIATRVRVELQLTDPSLKVKDRIEKRSEKASLYEAMDIGSIWLERALNAK